jgi:hypothetical protein
MHLVTIPLNPSLPLPLRILLSREGAIHIRHDMERSGTAPLPSVRGSGGRYKLPKWRLERIFFSAAQSVWKPSTQTGAYNKPHMR